MLKTLKKWSNKRKLRKSLNRSVPAEKNETIPVAVNLETNKEQVRSLLGHSNDIIMREFQIAAGNNNFLDAVMVSIDGLIDETAVRENVLHPLMAKPLDDPSELSAQIKQRLYLKSFETETDLYQSILNVLKGSALLLIDGLPEAFVLHIEGFEVRGIDEPPTEAVVKGPREGFVESMATNLALLRRRIKHPSLRYESMVIGQYTKSSVIIAYIQGIADPQLVERVKAKLRDIQTDSLLSSGELEQYIEDAPYSIFPTVGNTERPDKAAAMLLEGRIAIIVDGDPGALIVPFLFIQSLQNQEDYSSRPYFASFIRLLRVFAFVISVSLPSIYILAMNFHKEVIPSELIVTMTEARQRVPFPLVMELAGLTIIFEIVREAGVRMPRAIGQAVSIVGALILGQVSVQAGFIGAPTIIVVAISAIASFIITPVAEVAGLLRLLLIIPTAMFGFFGFLGFGLAVLTHMVSLTSLGVPYMSPISPFYYQDWKDALVRLPYLKLRKRPRSIPHLRTERIQQMPGNREGKP